MVTYWTPLACLSGMRKDAIPCNGEKAKYALVVVNMPLDGMVDKFKTLWDAASVKASTDGGSNRLHSIGLVEHDVNRYVPDFISGDLDSITDDVLKFYKEKGVEVIPTPDQDETDLTKCLRILFSRAQSSYQFDYVVVVNALGKRLDQTMANIETLFHALKMTEKQLFLLSEDSLGCLLAPGKHVIEVNTGLEHEWCGLIPIGAKCTQITTTGLKWNLTNDQLEFGKLISTSNTYDGSDTVTIETDTPILWTMGVK